MSFRRQLTLLSIYSLSPVRYKRLVMVTSEYSVASRFLVFLKVSETSAICRGFRLRVPLKMMLSILSERKAFVFCSPSTQRMASTTFDFPQPFCPTIPVTPSSKLIVTLSPKLLNPFISSFVSNIFSC